MPHIQQGRGVVCADLDGDGDVDIWTQNSGAFWLNGGSADTNSSLTVRLFGSPPNTAAANARIRVTVGGVTQLREVIIGNNFTSQNPTDQIFGLGSATVAEMLVIEWPSGPSQTFWNVASGLAIFREP